MTPIAISNQRPGFVPFSARPLAIAGMTPSRVRPTYTPAPYRPPMLANKVAYSPEMGQGFKLSELPLSITLGIAGGAALVLAGIVPTPAKELATVAGLGLIAFGVLNLFPASAGAAEKSTPAAEAEPFKTADPNDFGKVTAKISKPSWNEAVSLGLFSSDYDIEIVWTNGSDKAVSVPYRISVDERPEPSVSWLSTSILPFKGVVYTGIIKLGPRQSVAVPLEIDLKSEGFVLGNMAVGIDMKVEKISSSNQVFVADKTSFVVY